MIVRILHEGQFRLKGADLDVINDLDNELVACVAAGDNDKFGNLLERMLDLVRQHGKPVDVDEFIESDVILPASGSTMDEVQHMFAGEGLIPG